MREGYSGALVIARHEAMTKRERQPDPTLRGGTTKQLGGERPNRYINPLGVVIKNVSSVFLCSPETSGGTKLLDALRTRSDVYREPTIN